MASELDRVFGTSLSIPMPKAPEQPAQEAVKEPEVVEKTVETEVKESPVDSFKKALKVPVEKFVEKKHELKQEKENSSQLQQEVETLKAKLAELENPKEATFDLNKYFTDVKDDDIVDGSKMKSLLSAVATEISQLAFKNGAEAAVKTYEQKQAEMQAKTQEKMIVDMTTKIESDVQEFQTKNPNVDIEALSLMLTQDDVSKISSMSGNYAENAYKLVQDKLTKLGISQPNVTKPENETAGGSADVLFNALESYRKQISGK